MALYLVIHHKLDGQQWNNSWLDENRLQSIATTEEIGRLCAAAKAAGERVFIHRCEWVSDGPSICCAVRVARTARLPGHGALVEFEDPALLSCPPSVQPRRGQDWYESDPVDVPEAVPAG
jgi:hypothetical protein